MTHSGWRDAVDRVEGELLDVVERKVKAAGTAAFLVGLAVQLLGLYVFHGDVPDWVTAGVGSLVTGGLTFVAGWVARHTPRTIPPAPADPAPPVPPTA